MRLREIRDVFLGQDIYIVGSGPTTGIFPFGFLADKICISLNDAYKMHPAMGPVAFMHHELYSRTGDAPEAPLHPHFAQNIRYPIVKVSGKNRVPSELVDWENPHFYYFDWAHDIENISTLTKDTDILYYTSEGCSLHAALQVAWIMGARNIFTIGCDSRTLGGKHYAQYDKNGFRATEVMPQGQERNYDSYVKGTLLVQEFLQKKNVAVFNLSPIVGYHLVDYQYEVLKGEIPMDSVLKSVQSLEPTP